MGMDMDGKFHIHGKPENFVLLFKPVIYRIDDLFITVKVVNEQIHRIFKDRNTR